MKALRHSSFETRRDTYLEKRTADQEDWYSKKAETNKGHATDWRRALIVGELLALVIAAVAFGRGVEIDFAGIAAALVASGAAWAAIKQHSQLTSAYRVATSELALQRGTLEQISEEDWPRAAANAEEAISREHTMWLASRGEEPLRTN